MRTLFIGIIMSLASATSWACEGTYKGDLELAKHLENKSLNCEYNGQKSVGSIVVSFPRCFNVGKGKAILPTVTLSAFDDEIEILSIESRVLHGYAKTFPVYSLTNNKTDLPISCVERN